MTLCEHVDLEEDGDTVRVTRGTAVPVYSWSRALKADVPRLRCPVCESTVRLPGPAVSREARTTAPNRIEDGWELL